MRAGDRSQGCGSLIRGQDRTMNSVDLANEQVFAEVKRLCLMGLDPTTLRQRFTEQLKRTVPFEGYVAFTMDPSSGLITHALAEEMGARRKLASSSRMSSSKTTSSSSTG